jgi:hypothetical protein
MAERTWEPTTEAEFRRQFEEARRRGEETAAARANGMKGGRPRKAAAKKAAPEKPAKRKKAASQASGRAQVAGAQPLSTTPAASIVLGKQCVLNRDGRIRTGDPLNPIPVYRRLAA